MKCSFLHRNLLIFGLLITIFFSGPNLKHCRKKQCIKDVRVFRCFLICLKIKTERNKEMWQFVWQFSFFFCCWRLFAQERSSSHPATEFVLNPRAAFDYFLLLILMAETLFGLERDYTILLSTEGKHSVQYQICWSAFRTFLTFIFGNQFLNTGVHTCHPKTNKRYSRAA